MLVDLSCDEIEVLRRALRAAVDLGDSYYTFAPSTSCGGAKVHYGSGDLEAEEILTGKAKALSGRLRELMRPETIYEKMSIIQEAKENGREIREIDPRQTALPFGA